MWSCEKNFMWFHLILLQFPNNLTFLFLNDWSPLTFDNKNILQALWSQFHSILSLKIVCQKRWKLKFSRVVFHFKSYPLSKILLESQFPKQMLVRFTIFESQNRWKVWCMAMVLVNEFYIRTHARMVRISMNLSLAWNSTLF